MVRHGRLSKGCQTCRKRKIKCDQLLPSCTQCRKGGWVCPQYGDSVERMFQYEDPNCFKKNRKEDCLKEKMLKRRGTVDFLSPAVTVRGNIVPPFNLTKEITQPVNDLAIDYFLSTHTFREDGALRGCFEYLLVSNDILTHKEVSSSLKATALTAYGNKFRHTEILHQARRYYGHALRLVNRALECQREAATNCTMISILLLNTFEALTSQSRSSMVYSDGHMRGVMMIMNLRGQSLMDTREGLQVFLHMCRCLITYCIMRPVRVPAEVIGLRAHAAKFLDRENPPWKMEEIMIKLAGFRADVSEGVLIGHSSIIERALQLDDELSALLDDMPIQWRYEEFASEEILRATPPPYYHIYPDLWVAYVWNYIRTCRLLLHKEIRDQLAESMATPQSSSTELMNLHEVSERTSDRMISDICASVAQYFRHSPKIVHNTDALPAYSENAFSTVPSIAGAYFLLWPLMTSGHITESSVYRDWITRHCRVIGQLTGIKRALAIADTLDNGEELFL
ncbi:hypothetical protein BDW59DRAFT_12123 [Aspergillus cavernicola]|uniref:Zn(2)-C6 fungal-type domain-containing protein n=1 Tax=Aspergillus cavernicola TaxID=176166 RepID=A0ABR4HKQ2_9EURO